MVGRFAGSVAIGSLLVAALLTAAPSAIGAGAPSVTIQPVQVTSPNPAAMVFAPRITIPLQIPDGVDTSTWFVNVCDGERGADLGVPFNSGGGRWISDHVVSTPVEGGMELSFEASLSWQPGLHNITTLVYDARVTGFLGGNPEPNPVCNTASPGLTSGSSSVDLVWAGGTVLNGGGTASYGSQNLVGGTLVYGPPRAKAKFNAPYKTPSKVHWRYKPEGRAWSETKTVATNSEGRFGFRVPVQRDPYTLEVWSDGSPYLNTSGRLAKVTKTVKVIVPVHMRTRHYWTVDRAQVVTVTTALGKQARGFCTITSSPQDGYGESHFRSPLANGVARFALVAPSDMAYHLVADCHVVGYPTKIDETYIQPYY